MIQRYKRIEGKKVKQPEWPKEGKCPYCGKHVQNIEQHTKTKHFVEIRLQQEREKKKKLPSV